jgi:hypothetical protein
VFAIMENFGLYDQEEEVEEGEDQQEEQYYQA